MKRTKNLLAVIGIGLLGGLIGWWIGQAKQPIDAHSHGDAEVEIEASSSQSQSEVQEWTCSMHPQIRMPEPGKCPICGMDLIPVTAEDAEATRHVRLTKSAVALANIETQVVQRRDQLSRSVLSYGKIEADERRTWSQTAHIPGRIEKTYVTYRGQYIRKGQKIAELYSPELITAQQELLEAHRHRQVNPGLVESARAKLLNWKIPPSFIDEVLKRGKPFTTISIYADISGYILQKNINPGDHVREGSVLYTVNDLNKVWLMLEIEERDLPWVKAGTKVDFVLQAQPGKQYTATIDYVYPVLKEGNTRGLARATVANHQRAFKPGMFVQAKIRRQIPLNPPRPVIPKTAVLWTGEQSVVWVKASDTLPLFEYREVLLGLEGDEGYAIERGVDEGDEIVVNGSFVIDAEAQLSGLNSMMNALTSEDLNAVDTTAPDAMHQPMKCGAGKCGGGKCGGGKCGGGKCGGGKCGGGKCGTGKCGSGKCGNGKCGGGR